jgi:hypothetical protein
VKKGRVFCPFFLQNKKMKKLLSTFVFLSASYCFSQVNNVVVNGTTNINTFKCVNDKFNPASDSYSFKKNQLPHLQLSVNDFDCNNRIMTNDLRKTLKADQFPVMSVKFLTFIKVSEQQYRAYIEVKLVGKTRYYTTDFHPIENSFVGREYVKFSDFGITPPTKMGGLIVVHDDLDLLLTLKNY